VPIEVLRDDVGIERIHPDAERHLALELRRRAGQHHMAACLGPRAQLAQQACLADAGLSLERHVDGTALAEHVQGRLEVSELAVATDDPRRGGTGP
jgi:hypothetical protein